LRLGALTVRGSRVDLQAPMWSSSSSGVDKGGSVLPPPSNRPDETTNVKTALNLVSRFSRK